MESVDKFLTDPIVTIWLCSKFSIDKLGKLLFYKRSLAFSIKLLFKYKVYKEGNFVIGPMIFMQFSDRIKVLRNFHSIEQNFWISSILHIEASRYSNFLNSLKFNSEKVDYFRMIEDILSLFPISFDELNDIVEIWTYLTWGKFISFNKWRLGFVEIVTDYNWVNLLFISKA